jgi:hypothetical protein
VSPAELQAADSRQHCDNAAALDLAADWVARWLFEGRSAEGVAADDR